jgi:chorismate dehydratase
VAVASYGPVRSVFLAHRDPLERLGEVHLDPASRTSVNLLAVLLRTRGLSPPTRTLASYARETLPANALLIGNPAIEFALGPHTHALWDLGEAWRDLTGLPFVYAVWAIRRDAPADLANRLRAAKARGLGRLTDFIRDRTEFTPEFRRAYLGGHIRYDLDARSKSGLEDFRRRLEATSGRPTFAPRFR